MEPEGTQQTIAPGLQQAATSFLESLQWSVERLNKGSIEATKKLAGEHTIRWVFRFEDERSLSQAGSPSTFAGEVARDARAADLFDLLATDDALNSHRWKEDLAPLVDRSMRDNRNFRWGTYKGFLNRFASEISEAYQKRTAELLKRHFVQRPVNPSFASGEIDAVKVIMDWTGSGDSSRIMLIKGDAGSGKSVFTLMLVRELHTRFASDPNRYPAPFLVWFSNQRPPTLNDLIPLTLNDLALSQTVTPEGVKYLLKQGRLILILDGFDEISRALAQNAEDNVQELGSSINRNTVGRLILTSRPSFVAQEQIFANLKSACEEDVPGDKDLAPYTDDQIDEWILRNPPPESGGSPGQHWQRVQTAFRGYPALKELCRTPVFLRMLSEVLVKERSVKSLSDLVHGFCTEMWERERGKRNLTLSDDQYFYAYEAMAVMIADEQRISPADVKVALELYFADYAPELTASLPDEAGTLIADLSIGPLTYRGGVFAFVHEVLHAYFLSRMLARSLKFRRKTADLWNRQIDSTVWKFLPQVVDEMIPTGPDREGIVREIAPQTTSGLVMWNTAKALGFAPAEVAKILFEGKTLGSLVCERVNLSSVSFDKSTIYDVTFDRCDLSGATFRGARIKKMKFIECGSGARFDDEPLVDDESEVTLMGRPNGPEVYVGTDICKLFDEFRGKPTPRAKPPLDLGKQALFVIVASLFKADRRRLDYHEKFKIENRLRAWLGDFDLTAKKSKDLLAVFVRALDQMRTEGWICKNVNRPRTLLPCTGRQKEVAQIMRTGKIDAGIPGLQAVLSSLQEACDRVIASA